MKVDFIICGTQKGGTSALDVYLRGHPEICMAEKKEVHFFDNEEAFRDGTPDYAQYHSVFKPADLAIQSKCEVDRTAAEPDRARLLALEYETRARRGRLVVLGSDSTRARTVSRGITISAPSLFVRRPRFLFRAAAATLVVLPQRTSACFEKR